MRAAALPLFALMLLAGCNQTDTAQEASPAPKAGKGGGTDYVAAVRDMPEAQRRATFLRAIRDAGQACQQVVEDRADAAPATSERDGTTAGAASWGVRCEDGRGWLITMAPDGNAKVTGPVASK